MKENMDIIKQAAYAVYSRFPNWYGAQQTLRFLDKRFGRFEHLTAGKDPFPIYAGFYGMLSGENPAWISAALIERAARRIEKHADKQATYTAAEYAEMLTALKADIEAFGAECKKLNEARILSNKHFDTIGGGAQAVLKAYKRLAEHNAVTIRDIDDGNIVLWAYLQGMRAERARHTHTEGTDSPTDTPKCSKG